MVDRTRSAIDVTASDPRVQKCSFDHRWLENHEQLKYPVLGTSLIIAKIDKTIISSIIKSLVCLGKLDVLQRNRYSRVSRIAERVVCRKMPLSFKLIPHAKSLANRFKYFGRPKTDD